MKAFGNSSLVRAMTHKQTKSDILFNVLTSSIILVGCFIVLYPLYFILIASISDPDLVIAGQISFFPKGLTFSGYERIINYNQLWIGYRNSIFYAVAGALIGATFSLFAAYPLSRSDFSGKKFITIFLLITMFFDGGLIPTYILVRGLGLRNTYACLLVVRGIQVMNILIATSYFRSSNIDSLYEAAQIDGCSHFGYLFKILIPISTPIIIVMLLFYGVFQWNDFFRAMIYLDKPQYQPLQIVLKDLLASNQVNSEVMEMMSDDIKAIDEMIKAAESMKYGIIIMATLPMLLLYLVLQKYFEKGITMGSVKG
ncbi:MAG: carbohydrate ABC transporter permease [Spirochaetales bacterium]|nr:carbohydrate ABC transporter permease [Spirochaetales bacterium]